MQVATPVTCREEARASAAPKARLAEWTESDDDGDSVECCRLGPCRRAARSEPRVMKVRRFTEAPSEDAVNATLSGVCPRGDAGGPGCLQETL